jgi:putative effector of murein hydrolase
VNSNEALHILGGSLSVSGPSAVSGDFKLNAALLIVKGNIATFAATSTTNIDNGQFSIEQGGLAVFPNATSYDATGMGGGVYQFVVNGNGSKLDLSSLTTMKVSTPSSWHAIKAENGGILDLSNVVTINGTTGNVSNPFYIEAFGGQILLPKLTTFLGPWVKFTATNAATLSLPSYAITTPINFHITNAQIDIPQITTLNSAHVELNGSSAVFNTGMLTNIDKTRFYINNGAIFNKIVATNYDATGMGGGVYQFIVNGNGSKLDLSSLATMKVSTPSSWHAIKAENGGILDLSNVVTINGITGNVSNPFYIEAFGGQILLPKLTTFLGPWVKFTATNAATLSLPSYAITTPIDFHITNAQIDIPQITTLNSAYVELNGSGAVFNTGTLTNIDKTRFVVTGGATFNRVSATSYDATGMGGGLYQLIVNGTGSKLDLSSLTTMKVSTPSSWHAIHAANNGILDLSNVVTINGTTGNVSNPFYIEAFGGQILLPKLTTFLGPWVKFSVTNAATLSLPSYAITTPIDFHITNAQIDIPQITTLNSAYVELSGSSAVFNTGMLTNIDNTRFRIQNGAVFNKVIATNYDTTVSPGRHYHIGKRCGIKTGLVVGIDP